MSEESPLLELRDQLQAKVDAKLREMPEWRQLKALEDVIAKTLPTTVEIELVPGQKATVVGLAMAFIGKAGEPKPTREIVPYVDSVKKFGDARKAKINVVSALSKDKRLQSLTWNGEPMWWLAGKPLPKQHVSAP